MEIKPDSTGRPFIPWNPVEEETPLTTLSKVRSQLFDAEKKLRESFWRESRSSVMEKPYRMIGYSISLLEETYPTLEIIKERLGKKDAYYLKLSTDVVKHALNNVIQAVNEAQKNNRQLSYNIFGFTVSVETVFARAWKAMRLMEKYDMESDFIEHYWRQNESLRTLCEGVGLKIKKTKKEIWRDFVFACQVILFGVFILGLLFAYMLWAIT